MVKVDGNLLERLFLFIIRFKIFQVPFALFFNNSSLFHNRQILLDVESGAVCSYIFGIFLTRWSGKIIIFLYNFVLLPNGFLQARIITETIVQVYRLPKALGILKEKLKLRSQT